MLFHAPLLALVATTALAHPYNQRRKAIHNDALQRSHQSSLETRSNSTSTSTSHLTKRAFNGFGTFYYTGLGACGGWNNDNDWIVALNEAQFDFHVSYPGPHCGKTITVSANGKTVSGITVTDMCPYPPTASCQHGDLDMSPGLFEQFAHRDVGRMPIQWWWDDGSSQHQEPAWEEPAWEEPVWEEPKPEPTPEWTPTSEWQPEWTPEPTPWTEAWTESEPEPTPWTEPQAEPEPENTWTETPAPEPTDINHVLAVHSESETVSANVTTESVIPTPTANLTEALSANTTFVLPPSETMKPEEVLDEIVGGKGVVTTTPILEDTVDVGVSTDGETPEEVPSGNVAQMARLLVQLGYVVATGAL